MEGTALLEAIDSTNIAQEESLTPDRPNTPEYPPPTIKTSNNSNLDDMLIDKHDSINNTIKPTFKNIQQAKKRLQAFSVQKSNQLPTSPLAKKAKIDEKIDETGKKLPKKPKDPNEKAKAVIEEIEEIKRNEQAYLESVRASFDKEHFKKIEKKSRNIRKRSPSLEKFKKPNNNNNDNNIKERKRYPKNWKEFNEMNYDFDELKREFDHTPPKGNNDLLKQLLFESPSLPIVQTKMKTLNREEKFVPFQYLRYTKSKPVIAFNVNFNKIKEKYVNRKAVLETVPKEIAANIEKLYTNSLKFKTDYSIKVRNWYPKSWKDYNSECKLLENSVGLSFLQSYTEDEDNEAIINNDDNNKESLTNKMKKIDTKKRQKRNKTKSKRKKRSKQKKHKHKSDNIKIPHNDNKNDINIDINSINIDKNDEKLDIIENLRETIDDDDDNNTKIEMNSMIIDKSQINADEQRVKTPDTDDYHSHWESDDDLTTMKPTRPSIKLNRSWESDEELFERSGNIINNDNNCNNTKQCDYNNLEIPLNLKNIITRKPINIDNDNVNNHDDKSNENNHNDILKIVNLNLDLDIITKDNNNVNLENQYEEFIKAVSKDSLTLNEQQQVNDSQKESDDDDDDDGSSSDTSSSTSSTSSSSSSDSSSTNINNNNNNNSKKKKKYKLKKSKRKRSKIKDIFNEFDIPVPSDLPDVGSNHSNNNNNNNNVLPLPVPSPDQALLSSTTEMIDLKKPFIFSTITIQSKKSLIDNSQLKLNDDDSDSCDFTEKFLKKSNEDITEDDILIKTTPIENTTKRMIDKKYTNRERKYRNSIKKPLRRRYSSPLLRRCSPKRRRSSPLSPQLQQQQRRRLSPRRRSLSPRRRSISPRYRRLRSPTSRKRTPSPQSRIIKRALSPINSPLDGFKKSVADSTISDDMLPQPSIDDYSQSPILTYNTIIDNNINNNNKSPKRLSLDERINQVLGFEKHDNKQTNIDNYDCYNNYQYEQQYYGQYQQNIGYNNYNLTNVQQQQSIGMGQSVNTPTKVVQIGNILQVVPNEEVPHNLLENTPIETGQKIVQVGNMLQIVPAVMQPTIENLTTTTTAAAAVTTTITTTTTAAAAINPIENNQQIDENRIKQRSLERKIEREKRRLERMRRRKEKEKKCKERERRHQLKLKLKTENMIKKALQLEADALFDEDDDDGENQWPPIQVVVSTSSDTPNKSILLASGFCKIDGKKSVQFADGIRPGEGTSPSGGEELSSPPPKSKRHKKIKLPKRMKKKKIKVKVKRIQQQQQQQQDDNNDDLDDDDDANDNDDNLPPPSPPPGSPPPHVFPSRVKEPTFNNINPYIVANSPYVTTYPRQPIPPPPMLINRPPYMPGSFHPVPDIHHNSFPGANHGVHH